MPPIRLVSVLAAAVVLAGCANQRGDFDTSGGIYQIRSACPRVGVAAGTGDITLFDPATARTADAIDVTATMTDVRGNCHDDVDPIVTDLTFRVDARRRDAGGPRDINLPFFVTVVQGGNQVVAKRISNVAVHFDAGQLRASANGSASASVSKAAATLPENVRRRLTEKRKAGDTDAAVDPLSRPEIRGAVARSTFEALLGFQLTDDQLKYNATR